MRFSLELFGRCLFFFSAFFYENKRPKRLRFFSSCRCNSDRVVGSRTRNVSITKICYCVLFFQFYQHLFINANQKSHSHSEHRGTEVNLSSCCSPVKCMSKCFSLQVLFLCVRFHMENVQYAFISLAN